MTDHKHATRPPLQNAGDQGPPLGIQMIGRLIQHQHVRRIQQQGRKAQPRLFAATQRPNPSRHVKIHQPDLHQSLGDPRLQTPVRRVEVLRRTATRQNSRKHRHRLRDHQRLCHRFCRVHRRDLRQPPHAPHMRDAPLGRIIQTDDKSQQRGFAYTVSAHQSGALPT